MAVKTNENSLKTFAQKNWITYSALIQSNGRVLTHVMLQLTSLTRPSIGALVKDNAFFST